MRVQNLLAGAVIAAGVIMPSSASAAVGVGDTVTCNQVGRGAFVCSPASATVGTGIEFTIGNEGGPTLSADFSQGVLQITALRTAGLSGTILSFANQTNPFTSFALASNNGFTDYNVANTSITNNTLTINLIGTTFTSGSTLNYVVSSLGPVPEPATWAMMILGMGGVGFAMRRRKSKVTTNVAFA